MGPALRPDESVDQGGKQVIQKLAYLLWGLWESKKREKSDLDGKPVSG